MILLLWMSEAEDSSADSTYVLMDDEDSDSYDGIEYIDRFDPVPYFRCGWIIIE